MSSEQQRRYAAGTTNGRWAATTTIVAYVRSLVEDVSIGTWTDGVHDVANDDDVEVHGQPGSEG